MRLGPLDIQYHRMPKYIMGGKIKTTAPSYIRIFFRHKFILDIPMPKYGKE